MPIAVWFVAHRVHPCISRTQVKTQPQFCLGFLVSGCAEIIEISYIQKRCTPTFCVRFWGQKVRLKHGWTRLLEPDSAVLLLCFSLQCVTRERQLWAQTTTTSVIITCTETRRTSAFRVLSVTTRYGRHVGVVRNSGAWTTTGSQTKPNVPFQSLHVQ